MRKYTCDNCGKEFDTLTNADGTGNLWGLRWNRWREHILIGEYCSECKAKIMTQIKELYAKTATMVKKEAGKE